MPTPTKYTFSVANDFSAGVDLAKVIAEANADQGITPAVDETQTKAVGDVFDLWFDDALDAAGLTALHGDASPPAAGSVLGDHAGPMPNPPTITGSRAGNAALASLLTALHDRGHIIDNTTI